MTRRRTQADQNQLVHACDDASAHVGQSEGVEATRIVLVDDHSVFLDALAAVLGAQPDIDVVGTAVNAQAARRVTRSVRPDLCVVDVNLGTDDGLVLASGLREESGLPSVVLTEVIDPERVVDGVRAGVTCWVLKEQPTELLLAVLRFAVRGGGYLPPNLVSPVLRRLAETSTVPAGPLRLLTPRELEILQCLVDGLDRTAIAAQLRLSPHTIRTHAQNMLGKLDVHSSLEAVAVALGQGMRPLDRQPLPRKT